MTISLVITTFNRCALLAEALQSVAASNVADPKQIEVIVVDNNSEDDTPATVERFQSGTFPFPFPFRLQYVLERQQGLSAARNRGIAESSGVYVVFMDDDQRIDRDYLNRVEHVFSMTGAGAAGGPIHYYNATSAPAWATELLAVYGQYDAGKQLRELTPGQRLLNGGNMAAKRDILKEVEGFDCTLGRCGASLLADEDADIQKRIQAAGHSIFYSPLLCQYHYLDPRRLTKSYWRRHRFDLGRTQQRQAFYTSKSTGGSHLFGVPRWFWSALVTREVPRYLLSFFGASAKYRFERQLDIFVLLGRIHEARAQREGH